MLMNRVTMVDNTAVLADRAAAAAMRREGGWGGEGCEGVWRLTNKSSRHSKL